MQFRFSNPMWHWRGPSPFYFITVPAEISADIKELSRDLTYGWGMIPVTARIGATTFTTSLFEKDGGYILPIKKLVRIAEELEQDTTVAVRMDFRLN